MKYKKVKKKSYKWIYLFNILFIFIATICMILSLMLLNGIENKIRFLFCIDLILIFFFFFYLLNKNLKKKGVKKVFSIFWFLYSFILIIVSFYIKSTYKTIDKMSNSTNTYYSSLVTLKSNKAEKIDDISGGVIGYISDTESVDGNQMPKEIIKSESLGNVVREYSSYDELIDALLDKEIDYIFLPGNYLVMFSDYSTLENDTKVIYTKEKNLESVLASSGTSLDKPFSILIMGVDSEKESISGSTFNGDALMLLTFNPKTLNTTILSIPRDSYVPITCFKNQAKNKITHAAWYGADCMINTISKFLDVDINYYVKINFKGVVKIIDSLGGVDVDVPYSFCEQDSNRKWGKNTIYVKKGFRTLNGEEALALSRNRKSNYKKCSSEWTNGVRNDFVRGQNQQLVLRAILNKMKSSASLDMISKLLSTVSDNMETNMTTSEILSLYNIGKDILVKSSDASMDELLSFNKLYLNGEDAYLYDSRTGYKLYNYVLYPASVKAVSNAMKINLELSEPTLIKDFEFDVAEEYTEEVIGKKETGNTGITKLPNFIGMTETSALAKAQKLGVSVSLKYQSGTGNTNLVVKQNYLEGTDVDTIKTLTLTISKDEE